MLDFLRMGKKKTEVPDLKVPQACWEYWIGSGDTIHLNLGAVTVEIDAKQLDGRLMKLHIGLFQEALPTNPHCVYHEKGKHAVPK